MFRNTDQVIIQYGTHHKELLEMQPKIGAFPSNVILYFRLVKRFFSDEYVKVWIIYDFHFIKHSQHPN